MFKQNYKYALGALLLLITIIIIGSLVINYYDNLTPQRHSQYIYSYYLYNNLDYRVQFVIKTPTQPKKINDELTYTEEYVLSLILSCVLCS